MLNKGPSFIEILKSEFQNPAVAQKYRESSLQKLNDQDRIFDTFKTLISEDNLNAIINELTILLHSITHVFFEEKNEAKRPVEQLSDADKNIILGFEKKIIDKARQELLDENNQIKKELIALLGWEAYLDKLDRCAIVSAFVSAIHQQMTPKLDKELLQTKNYGRLLAYWNYVNHHYGKWIKNEIEPSLFTRIVNLPANYPSITTTIGIGLLTVSGLLLFSNTPEKNRSPKTSLENNNRLPL